MSGEFRAGSTGMADPRKEQEPHGAISVESTVH
jgi:hypothetical protein